MDLSIDIENLHDNNTEQKPRSREDCSSMYDCEILDLTALNLDNEETWLYKPQNNTSDINPQDWLYGKCDIPSSSELPPDFIIPKLKSTKNIDTRTFTRPKKKFIRPSINDYEQLYLSGSDGNEMNSSTEASESPKWPQTVKEEQESAAVQPLHFDLSQPTSLHNFDSFMINSADVDSFQNMSPPSLVNSLCSSTFANLMESSFIKNDPVLREIRDKDFTETALLQDTEAPMFQSITESCSSLNSDTPESFLKKVSCNGTFRKNISDYNTTITPERTWDSSMKNGTGNNSTFEVQNLTAHSNSDNKNDATFPIDTTPQPQNTERTLSPKPNQTPANNLNGTYRRTPKHNGTYRKSDLKNKRLSLNLTYEMPIETNVLDRDVSKSIENDMNNSNKGSSEDTKSSTRTVILRSDSIESLKKRFSTSDLNMDLNRLSYCMEERDDQVNTTYEEEKVSAEMNRTVEIKRSSLGSADSLDRMSSLSSSSKGSTKVLSIEDVEAIVEMQDRNLSQVMSTPKPHTAPKKLWENNFISPIVADAKDQSDSELSDEYKSVTSQVSSKVSLECWKKPATKSLGYLAANNDFKLKTSQKNSFSSANQRPLQTLPNSIRGSYTNISTLKSTSSHLGGSHSNLFRPNSNTIRPPSTSNLKTMGTKLKGSYTSLKPISANLPVVPPVGTTLNSTQTMIRRRDTINITRTMENTRMEVPPPREKVVPAPAESTFTKPQIPRASGLPRPTGIPRPASRIPGPRSSNIR